MIYIGTDIVPSARIDKLIQEKGKSFLNHIFTNLEQSICDNKSHSYVHYSGKFAAKEAVKKALLSTKSFSHISLKAIEVLNDPDGVPIIQLLADNIKCKGIQVSISHAGEYATATAILEF